jgi:hypothetical protein
VKRERPDLDFGYDFGYYARNPKRAPYALTKKLIDTEAEELVKCDRCPRRVPHTHSYWFNDERGRHLLCSSCYRELCK